MTAFKKMHGLGNDFVIIDARDQDISLSPEQIQRICDRNFGVGCDQLVILERAAQDIVPSSSLPPPTIKVNFYNADGSESDACGNATRCVADIILNETGNDTCIIETGGGLLYASRADSNMITVNMGEPRDIKDLPLEGNPIAVNMGNPHAVHFVDDADAIDLPAIGPKIEHHELFPNRTNVEFVHVIAPNILRQRTWERGAGETLACGSGACATTVAAVTRGLTDRKVEIQLDGGSLFIEWQESDNTLHMTGPVTYVFQGTL